MSDDLRGWSGEPLSKDELRELRRMMVRFPEHETALGPLVYALNRGKYWLTVLAIVMFLTSDWGRAVIGVIAEATP